MFGRCKTSVQEEKVVESSWSHEKEFWCLDELPSSLTASNVLGSDGLLKGSRGDIKVGVLAGLAAAVPHMLAVLVKEERWDKLTRPQ